MGDTQNYCLLFLSGTQNERRKARTGQTGRTLAQTWFGNETIICIGTRLIKRSKKAREQKKGLMEMRKNMRNKRVSFSMHDDMKHIRLVQWLVSFPGYWVQAKGCTGFNLSFLWSCYHSSKGCFSSLPFLFLPVLCLPFPPPFHIVAKASCVSS